MLKMKFGEDTKSDDAMFPLRQVAEMKDVSWGMNAFTCKYAIKVPCSVKENDGVYKIFIPGADYSVPLYGARAGNFSFSFDENNCLNQVFFELINSDQDTVKHNISEIYGKPIFYEGVYIWHDLYSGIMLMAPDEGGLFLNYMYDDYS